MITCPQCGHENVPGTQFCEGCGEELPAANAAPAAPAAMIQCPACDNMNPADNVACEVCGAELPRRAGAPAAPPATDASSAVLAAPASPAIAAGVPDIADLTAPPVAVPAADTSDTATLVAPPAPDAPSAPDVSMPTPAVSVSDAVAALPVAPTVTAPVAPLPAGDLAPGKVKLVVEQGQTVGAQFVLGDAEMLVGREDTEEDIYPDIDLSDQDAGYVHRRHATLRFDNGNLSVEHLGGSNKTRINNKPIPDNEPQLLKVGDKVSFGKVVLRVLPA